MPGANNAAWWRLCGSRSVSCSHMGRVRSGQSAEKAGQCEGRRLRDYPTPVPSWAGPASSLDPGLHHSSCVTHVSWCMSGSLTRGGGENVPGISGTCATRNFMYLARGPWLCWPWVNTGRYLHTSFVLIITIELANSCHRYSYAFTLTFRSVLLIFQNLTWKQIFHSIDKTPVFM